MNRFGENLRVLRKLQRLTQQLVSDVLGVSRPYVAKMERGEKMPNAPMIIKIANIFGVTADQLMRDELELND